MEYGMPAALPQKGVFHREPATAVVSTDFPLLACQKGDLLALGRSVSRAGCVSLETVNPDQLRMDMSSQPQAMSPWEGSTRTPPLSLRTWQWHKDAPDCLTGQGCREKQANCLLSELR